MKSHRRIAVLVALVTLLVAQAASAHAQTSDAPQGRIAGEVILGTDGATLGDDLVVDFIVLVGSEIGAALTALAPLGVAAFGINCATGPELMHEHLRYLSAHSPLPIFCQPNAGLPHVENDRAVYDLDPQGLRDALGVFVGEYGVSLIGGCCGTTPAHMAQVV